MRRGRVRDTSRHWTGNSAIRSWDVTCGCCLAVERGDGAKSGAGRELRARGWFYIRGWTRAGLKDGGAFNQATPPPRTPHTPPP